MRAAELERRPDQERRLALRLEIVRLGGLLEQRSNAPDVLRASLRERPGHAPTLGKLTDVLVGKSRQAELADILEDQARILEEDGEPVPAAALWADAARLVEGALADAGRAMTAWQNAVRLDAKTDALDALGRLALGAGQPAAAAEWLDRRLTMTEGDARNEVAARLAGAYVAANQRHRAIAVARARARRIPARRSAAHDAGRLLSRRGGLGAAGARAGRRLRSQRRRRR